MESLQTSSPRGVLENSYHSGGRSTPQPARRLKGLGVETDLQENDNANENQFQEMGRDVARQLQHSNLQARGSSLDEVAR